MTREGRDIANKLHASTDCKRFEKLIQSLESQQNELKHKEKLGGFCMVFKQIFKKLLIFFICPFMCFANNDWNGSQYSKNSKVQQSQAFFLLKEMELAGEEKILDIGCGNGKITTDLALLIPEGMVIGLDPSDSMLKEANKLELAQNIKNVSFRKGYAQNFTFEEKFDIAISIHVLHWIKEQSESLKNIYYHLIPGGKFYFIIVPSKEGLPFDRALNKTLINFKEDFLDFKNNQNVYDLETYRKLIVNAGFHIEEIRYTYHITEFDDKTHLTNWIKQWLPHYKFLEERKKEIFIQELMDNYLIENNLDIHYLGKIQWGEYVFRVNGTRPL